MIRVFLLCLFLCTGNAVVAQKDSITRKPITTVKLTNQQQKWLNANYKKIAGLKKDSASLVIRRSFGTISESALEFMIGQAGKLLQGDNQEQLALLQRMLDQLKQQKTRLQQQITEKEEQLRSEKDPEKRKAIEGSIETLRRQLREVEENIERKGREIAERE
jgi:uncharacterized protein YqgV (UPF0045/DUF77 family)